MTIEQLKEIMRVGIVDVEFTKVNGDIRNIKATLRPDMLPSFEQTINKRNVEGILTVWDVEINQWRSFRCSSITKVNGVEQNGIQ